MANYGKSRNRGGTTRTNDCGNHDPVARRPVCKQGMGHVHRNPVSGRPQRPHRTIGSVRGTRGNSGRRREVTETGSWWGDVEQRRELVCGGGYGFSYTAVRELETALKTHWRELRAEFALAGVDWRSWSAADRAAVAYRLAKQRTTDPKALRTLYELVDDKDAIAELDRSNMGQARTVETTR